MHFDWLDEITSTAPHLPYDAYSYDHFRSTPPTSIPSPESGGAGLVANHGRRSVLHRSRVLRAAGHVRFRLRHLGRRESRTIVQDVDVRRHTGDCAVLACRSHFPQTFAVQSECDLSRVFVVHGVSVRNFAYVLHSGAAASTC